LTSYTHPFIYRTSTHPETWQYYERQLTCNKENSSEYAEKKDKIIPIRVYFKNTDKITFPGGIGVKELISSDTFVKDCIFERYLFPIRSVSFH